MNDNDQAGLDDAFGEDWDGTLEPAVPGDSIMTGAPAAPAEPRAMSTEELIDLIKALHSPDRCSLDHDGDCQEHSFFGTGECPHGRARRLLADAIPGDSIMEDGPATEPEADTPPWVMARYDGECSGCFGPLMEGITEIRADGSGGWEGRCCE